MSIIAEARRSSHLDEEIFARLADMDPGRLYAVEMGQVSPTAAEVDRCACLLGLRVRDLLAGRAEQAPMTLLLNSAYAGGRPSLDELDATGAHRPLGEFVRAVRDVAELEDVLGLTRRELPPPLGPPSQPGVHPAEWEAARLRTTLGLGIDPVLSMRALLTDLGVRLFFTTPDELDQQIDGASTPRPRPAILANLVNGGDCWWHTRMTLAHELAHLLFDRARGVVIFSPHRTFLTRPRAGWRWQLFDDFGDIEVHADAFAACFLAPAEGVRKCVGRLSPSSEAAIGAVGARFGVGRTVAINRLQHVFNFPREVRAEMVTREQRRPYDADFSLDRVEAGIGVRRGELVALVSEALGKRVIGKARAWEYLGLPLTEELPAPGLAPGLRRPPVSAEDFIRGQAQHQLAARRDRVLHATRVEAVNATTWRVLVAEGGIGDRTLKEVGALILDHEGEVIEDHVTPWTPEG